MDRKNLILMTVAVLLVLIAIILLIQIRTGPLQVETPQPVLQGTNPNLPCPSDTLLGQMTESVMDGIIKRGQKFKVLVNWYACHSLEKGDLVYYRFSTQKEPVVRIIRALPGDKFKITKDKKRNAWNLTVNDEMVWSDVNEAPYFFGSANPATLSLYETSQKGILQDGDLIVLSNVPPGANDSGIFGVANVADIIGKVEPVQE